MAKDNVTAERLRELFTYEPDTGRLRWARGISSVGGRLAGTPESSNRYIRVMIDGRYHKAHRLIWAFVNGVYPVGPIDHINQNRADNRIANLRELTLTENNQNLMQARSDSKSGLRGVHWFAARAKWRSQISCNNKVFSLGYFATAEEAHAAYLAAKARLHPSRLPA